MLVALLVSLAISVPVALWFVGAAVDKTIQMPRQVVFNAEESVEYCAEALPDKITSQISYDELGSALRLHLEWIQAFHWTPESTDASPVVFTDNDPLSYMQERCDVVGLDLDEEQISAVMAAHYDYLQAKGALDRQPTELSELDLAEFGELEA